MTIKWIPPGPACPKCGGLNPKEVPCGSCDYKPGDPLFGKNELLTKEQYEKVKNSIVAKRVAQK